MKSRDRQTSETGFVLASDLNCEGMADGALERNHRKYRGKCIPFEVHINIQAGNVDYLIICRQDSVWRIF